MFSIERSSVGFFEFIHSFMQSTFLTFIFYHCHPNHRCSVMFLIKSQITALTWRQEDTEHFCGSCGSYKQNGASCVTVRGGGGVMSSHMMP